MSSSARDNASLGSLSTEINNIYQNYASNENVLEHSLDSNAAEPGYLNSPFLSVNYRRSLADRDTDGTLQTGQSEPGTPASSNSFDFNPAGGLEGYTNSSLNVLVGTPSSESAYRLLISSAPLIRGHHQLAPREGESLEDVNDDVDDDEEEEEEEDFDSREEDIEVIEEPSSDAISSVPPEDSKEDWIEKGAAVKELSGEISPQVIRRTVEDFQFGKDLGEGSYSTVVLATDKITRKKYAVKILDKRHIIKEKKVKYVNIEKHALNRLSRCPGIISLFFTFQDKHSLYFVLDYASNGELLTLIKRHGTLNEDCTKHLSAQILSALKHMHDNGVIHRDIKPENILLDDKFRIRITDFGTAKLLEKKKNSSEEEEEYPLDVRAKSFVGTAEYVSPELLENKYCGKPGDVWAFGCILYQMIAGKPPFKATNEYLTFQKITKLQYAFSAGFPLILRDLIKQILVLQPSRRATIEQIQRHYFFNDIDFSDDDRIWTTEIPEVGPYKASAKSMMKMPAHARSATPSPIVTKKTTSKPSPKPSQKPNRAPTARQEHGNNGKGFSAASVAALVLNKSEEEHETERSPKVRATPSSSSSSSRAHPAPEYIPGTNILRPTIHTMASFSRSQSSIKSDANALKKPKSRVMSVGPASAVEMAWQEFLQSPSERIINVGQAIFCKQTNEYFERKNKGIVHDAPLGMVNKLQAMDNRDSGSFLSQMAQGNKGFRETSVRDLSLKTQQDNESAAITYFVDDLESLIESIPEEKETEPQANLAGSTTKIGKGLFRKFLSHSDKKSDSQSDTNSVASAGSGGTNRKSAFSLEKARSCTVLVTTHGRLLVLTQEDQGLTQKLILEVRLNFPFIKFKEVISTGSKFTKMLPSTGIFAVQAILTTFVFEVDKCDVNKWTESLARSKMNQYERDYEADAKRKATAKSTKTPTPRTPDMSGASQSSRHVSTGSDSGASNRIPEEFLLTTDAKEKSQPLLKAKWKKGKSTKRRPPPPPLRQGHAGPTGLGIEGDRGEAGTIHAAQLAVSQSGHVMTENRRSSFSREGRHEYTPPPSHKPTGNMGTPTAKITSLNSKFLARSRGNK